MTGRTTGPRIALLAICLCTAAIATAGERIDETHPVAKDAEIRINNLAGTIDVIGWDKSEVRIECELDPKAKKLEINGDENDLEIKVKYPRRTRGDLKGSEMTVHVPRGCRLETESVSADVSVDGVVGDVEIGSVSGEISVSGKPESLEISAVSGDIFVSNVSRRLSVSNVSGDVEIKADELDAFAFNAVSGELDLTADPASRARWDIDCHSGEVTLYLPGDVDAEFDIDTFSGDINDDFGHKAERTSRYAPGKELSFVQGDGGARINISVFSGEVNIVKR